MSKYRQYKRPEHEVQEQVDLAVEQCAGHETNQDRYRTPDFALGVLAALSWARDETYPDPLVPGQASQSDFSDQVSS